MYWFSGYIIQFIIYFYIITNLITFVIYICKIYILAVFRRRFWFLKSTDLDQGAINRDFCSQTQNLNCWKKRLSKISQCLISSLRIRISADPDPHKNLMDPKHCIFDYFFPKEERGLPPLAPWPSILMDIRIRMCCTSCISVQENRMQFLDWDLPLHYLWFRHWNVFYALTWEEWEHSAVSIIYTYLRACWFVRLGVCLLVLNKRRNG